MNPYVKKDLMIQFSKPGEAPEWFTICILQYADDGFLTGAKAKTWDGKLCAKDLKNLTDDWFTWQDADAGLLAELRRAQSNARPA